MNALRRLVSIPLEQEIVRKDSVSEHIGTFASNSLAFPFVIAGRHRRGKLTGKNDDTINGRDHTRACKESSLIE